MPNQELLKPEQVAKILNVPKTTIYAWARARILPHVRLGEKGKVLRFKSDEIERFIEQNHIKAKN